MPTVNDLMFIKGPVSAYIGNKTFIYINLINGQKIRKKFGKFPFYF